MSSEFGVKKLKVEQEEKVKVIARRPHPLGTGSERVRKLRNINLPELHDIHEIPELLKTIA